VTLPFFTIGHSDRSLEELVELLREARVDLVADVRRIPRSRANPQFNKDTLPGALAAFDIRYEHMTALGGLRGRSKAVPPDTNGFWINDSFHAYADYALTPPFRAGLAHLRDVGHERRCTVMCAEALWWRCHRRIVADYLVAAGEPVFHIMRQGDLEPARLTPEAVVRSDGTIVYPAAHART